MLILWKNGVLLEAAGVEMIDEVTKTWSSLLTVIEVERMFEFVLALAVAVAGNWKDRRKVAKTGRGREPGGSLLVARYRAKLTSGSLLQFAS